MLPYFSIQVGAVVILGAIAVYAYIKGIKELG